MLSGDNGILQKAMDAKTETIVGQEKETIALAYNSALVKKVSNGNSSAVTDSELNDELDNSEATASGNPIIVTFTKTENAYEIDSQGAIKSSTAKGPNDTLKVAENKEKTFDANKDLVDDYGNKITLPKGFKITSDSPSVVTAGIVIEDVEAGTTATEGSQFVWIPVGTVYTNEEKSVSKTIQLKRYVFDENGNADETLSKTDPQDQLKTSSNESDYFTEGLKDETKNNIHAKDITAFISNTKRRGGYYIGRYEARTATLRTAVEDELTPITEKAEEYVYRYIKQSSAANLSQNMYSSSEFTSDLINSYAWDTAILYLQEFDNRSQAVKENSFYVAKYSRQTFLYKRFGKTGTNNFEAESNIDKICNVYDLAGNYFEWSTESYSNSGVFGVSRGGSCADYSFSVQNRKFCSKRFGALPRGSAYSDYSFRPLLYIN